MNNLIQTYNYVQRLRDNNSRVDGLWYVSLVLREGAEVVCPDVFRTQYCYAFHGVARARRTVGAYTTYPGRLAHTVCYAFYSVARGSVE